MEDFPGRDKTSARSLITYSVLPCFRYASVAKLRVERRQFALALCVFVPWFTERRRKDLKKIDEERERIADENCSDYRPFPSAKRKLSRRDLVDCFRSKYGLVLVAYCFRSHSELVCIRVSCVIIIPRSKFENLSVCLLLCEKSLFPNQKTDRGQKLEDSSIGLPQEQYVNG